MFSLSYKKNTQALLVFVLACLCSNAYALLNRVTLDGGLNYTRMNIGLQGPSGQALLGSQVNISQSYAGTGAGLNVSFDLYRWFSFEMGYNTMGSSKIASSREDVYASGDINFQGGSMYAVYSYPNRTYDWQLHGKVGLFSLSSKTNLSYVRQSNSAGLSMAGAVSYHARNGWGMNFNAAVHSANIQTFSLALSRRFSLVTLETDLLGEVGDEILDEEQNLAKIIGNAFAISDQARAANFQLSTLDDDGDGVSNEIDLCPRTPFDTNTDKDGCAIFDQASSEDLDAIEKNNALLYPDEQLVNEDESLDLDILGDHRFDPNIPIGVRELRGLLGFQRNEVEKKKAQINLNNFLDNFSEEQSLENNDEEISFEYLASLEEEVSGSLLGKQNALGLEDILQLGENDLDSLRNARNQDIFQAKELERRRLSGKSLLTQDNSEETERINNEFLTNVNILKAEIQQKIFQIEQESEIELGIFDGAQDNFNDLSISNIRPVRFDEGDFFLTADQQKYLEKIAANLRRNSRNLIQLDAWRHENGSEEVAKRQLRIVQNFLLENGVSNEQVENVASFSDVKVDNDRVNQIVMSLIEN